MSVFALASSAFAHAQPIPDRHSCEGADVSPPLRWANLPEGTRSLALVVDEPDAPGGVVGSTGVTGLTLGGGIGPLALARRR